MDAPSPPTTFHPPFLLGHSLTNRSRPTTTTTLTLTLTLLTHLLTAQKAVDYDYSFSGGYGSVRRTVCSEEGTIYHVVAYAVVAVPLCGGLFLAFKVSSK